MAETDGYFHQVEILYRLAGFCPERRLGIASRFSRMRNYWPTLLSSSVCLSGTFQGKEQVSVAFRADCPGAK